MMTIKIVTEEDVFGRKEYAIRKGNQVIPMFAEEEVRNEAAAKCILHNVAGMLFSVAEELQEAKNDIAYQEGVLDRQAEEKKELRMENDRLKALIANAEAIRKMESKKIKQHFIIPNDEEGQALIAAMRRYVQPGKQIVCRGRQAKNPKKYQPSIPLSDAKNIGVYVTEKD